MRLCEEKKIVPILQSLNINAGVDADSIDMSKYHHATFICLFGADLAGATGAVLKLYSGATNGTKTTALTFAYRYGGAAVGSANCDVLTDEATSAALTVVSATMAGRMLVIELDAAQMADGHNWLTLEVGSEADAGKLDVIAILEPRFKSDAGNTALA